jgi:hypothetical protein
MTRGDDKTRAHGGLGKNMVAGGNAARRLHIDVAVLDFVSHHDFPDDIGKRAGPQGRSDLQLGKRIGKPVEVPLLVNESATKYFADFIDAVGKLIAPVFDVDHGIAAREIAAIHIRHSAHARALNILGFE